MRLLVATFVLLALTAGTCAQTGDKAKSVSRYGVDLDVKNFPQQTPKDALGSVLKAIGEKQFDYLLAHLADPAFVDQQVSVFSAKLGPEFNESQKQAAAFNRLVKSIAANFDADPTKITELQRFHKEAEWKDDGAQAVGSLKELQARRVFMKRIAPERWVMLDREK